MLSAKDLQAFTYDHVICIPTAVTAFRINLTGKMATDDTIRVKRGIRKWSRRERLSADPVGRDGVDE